MALKKSVLGPKLTVVILSSDCSDQKGKPMLLNQFRDPTFVSQGPHPHVRSEKTHVVRYWVAY